MQRFDASLNEHVHFHVCVVDAVFEEVVEQAAGGADAEPQVQATLRQRFQVHDRARLERLLRYCARPPFAMPTGRWPDAHHRFHHPLRRHQVNFGSHQGGDGTIAPIPGTRATAVGPA